MNVIYIVSLQYIVMTNNFDNKKYNKSIEIGELKILRTSPNLFPK